ncbi:KGK domain-containing protein [Nostoc sp. UHCC 0926]|uniref:KGK domain-containing protein n=1 Tax=unclassified Nostoc TaxID=2593658 RepID=UPI00235E5ECA|nr:KGK domain-containing protein [Nostoc sp. UHCC 0926]WDD30781.1 KGK domain-containing protein [Nostoc sp. UHCC 0926]
MNDPVILSGNEVISIAKELSFANANLLKFEEIDRNIGDAIKSNFPNYNVWTGEISGGNGVSAEVLQPGKDWQNGRLKLIVSYRVEFTPDKVSGSESPLDDLRSQLNKPEVPQQSLFVVFGNP